MRKKTPRATTVEREGVVVEVAAAVRLIGAAWTPWYFSGCHVPDRDRRLRRDPWPTPCDSRRRCTD